MSSHSGYSSLGTGSESHTSGGSSDVVHGQYRSAKAEDYKVDAHRRRDVSIYNHHGSGYEVGAPHPGYAASNKKSSARR
ncbi:hypothetical protein GGR54DRAFT_641789 [Hypoxylon sp. NC1633]|nr:hypothetical protein GGR54DRAFT_641789 [Hypoxylon sp. NC1633]